MRPLALLTAAAAAAAILAATASAGLPGSARSLLAHREIEPKVELALANQTVKRAQDVLGFLRSHPEAGTETSRRRIRRDYAWLLRFGRSHQAHANARLSAASTPWPSWWLAQATCIHGHEGAWPDDTGNGYGGGMQFLVSTWNKAAARSNGRVPYVKSTGDIGREPIQTQLLAAYITWDGDAGTLGDGRGSWKEWGTAGDCGLA